MLTVSSGISALFSWSHTHNMYVKYTHTHIHTHMLTVSSGISALFPWSHSSVTAWVIAVIKFVLVGSLFFPSVHPCHVSLYKCMRTHSFSLSIHVTCHCTNACARFHSVCPSMSRVTVQMHAHAFIQSVHPHGLVFFVMLQYIHTLIHTHTHMYIHARIHAHTHPQIHTRSQTHVQTKILAMMGIDISAYTGAKTDGSDDGADEAARKPVDHGPVNETALAGTCACMHVCMFSRYR